MPFKANCPSCGKALQVPDAALGKKVKCPACTQVFQIARPVVDAEPEPQMPPVMSRFDEMMSDTYALATDRGGAASAAGPMSPLTAPSRRAARARCAAR